MHQQTEAQWIDGQAARAAAVDTSFRRLTFAERWALAEAEAAETARDKRGRALRELDELRTAKAAAPVRGRTGDAEIRDLAKRRAELMAERLDSITQAHTPAGLLAWLNGEVGALQGRHFGFEGDRPEGDQLRGFMARARCPLWWRRQLRRAAVQLREAEGITKGEICASRRQPYVTHDTAHRHAQRKAANAAMLEGTEIESESGQVLTLAEAAAASTSNPAIRRGELMTRISGCEKLAIHMRWVGLFLTLTAPSRFHRVHRHGGINGRSDDSRPKDAQAWLSACWARARAKLARLGVQVFGFRVAEPHHDACPHWHALLWVKPEDQAPALAVIKAAWLGQIDPCPMRPFHAIGCGQGRRRTLFKHLGQMRLHHAGACRGGALFIDPGARQFRVEAEPMKEGGAAGYLSKYVAKNIDDAGAVAVEGHKDETQGQGTLEGFGGNAARVQAWASAHGIRQFQAIGQPPVTVWRELRRVKPEAQAGASVRLGIAFEAVNRAGERRADWAAYVLAQGGVCVGKKYLLRIAAEVQKRHGRYEELEAARPIGVIDSAGPGDVHMSNRKEWKPRGAWTEAERRPIGGVWAPKAAPTWTRANNCTHRAPLMTAGRLARDTNAARDYRAWLNGSEPGAGSDHESHHGNQETHHR